MVIIYLCLKSLNVNEIIYSDREYDKYCLDELMNRLILDYPV